MQLSDHNGVAREQGTLELSNSLRPLVDLADAFSLNVRSHPAAFSASIYPV
jgi:hypothetical protein